MTLVSFFLQIRSIFLRHYIDRLSVKTTMSRKQRDMDGRQKDGTNTGNSKGWWIGPEYKLSSTAVKLALVLAITLACSFAYVLLLVFSSNHCLVAAQCRGKDCFSEKSIALVPSRSFSLDSQTQQDNQNLHVSVVEESSATGTSLGNIVFGIAATARLWERRKRYVKLWWRPNEMRGFIWLDEPLQNWSSALPPFRISGNISHFRYTHRGGRKAAIRISRIVSETFRVGLPDVAWFVMGDDDTIFVPENLVKVLSKYDHRKFYYVGASSESHHQNLMFSYGMAYGGGGFAISYALAKALERRHDECLQRYPFLYGSDDRIHACMAELGVPLTRELGFHQFDVYGDVSGLLSAHPITPLITMHHLDVINPIFPNMNQVTSLRHLWKAIDIDPSGVLQQSICYDRKRKWSISVSWGYMVKVSRSLLAPRDLEIPTRTFMSWNRKYDEDAYSFTSRPAAKNSCQRPVILHMQDVVYGTRDELSVSNYTRRGGKKQSDCKSNLPSPDDIDWVYVVKERADESWLEAPRRQCCQILSVGKQSIQLNIRDCRDGETIG